MKRFLTGFLALVCIAAALLFGSSRYLAARSEARHPAIGEFRVVDGQAVHFLDSGPTAASGPEANADATSAATLVLLHGASTSLLDFESSLRRPLEQQYRVIAFDRPGHGYSERGPTWPDPSDQARRVLDVLAQLDIDESIWIGHSWSGSVVLAGLLDAPLRIVGGVLLAGASHPWEGGSAWHAELVARPVIGPLFSELFIEPGGRLSLEAAIASVFDPEPVPPGYIDATGVELSLRPAAYRANADDLTRLSEYLETQSARYGSIDSPLLSITGSADTVVPAWNHDNRLQDQATSIHSVQIDGAGHALHHTRTARVVEEIERFVRTLAATGR